MARCILPVEVGVLFLLHPETAQIPVQIRLDPVARQRVTPALDPAPVEHDDRATGLGQRHKRLHVAAEAGQARHLRGPGAIHPDGEVVGKLGRARAARAGVNQWFVGHGRWCLRPVTTRFSPPQRAAGCVWSLHPPPAADNDFPVRVLSEKRDEQELGANGGWVHI